MRTPLCACYIPSAHADRLLRRCILGVFRWVKAHVCARTRAHAHLRRLTWNHLRKFYKKKRGWGSFLLKRKID
jgi:hypothetical protein